MARRCVFDLFVIAVLSVGCAHSRSAPVAPVSSPHGALVEGGPTAIGVLDFLNDHGHDLDLLDHAVGLDVRAARGLVALRCGPDGLVGTADDGVFERLSEVDAVPFVGPVSLQELAGFATAQGYVSQGHRTVGNFEGVRFTFAEADATLELVNDASHRTLDRTLHLDQRAVDSIVAARPIRSLGRLSELYYVGPSTLAQLKAHAKARSVASR